MKLTPEQIKEIEDQISKALVEISLGFGGRRRLIIEGKVGGQPFQVQLIITPKLKEFIKKR